MNRMTRPTVCLILGAVALLACSGTGPVDLEAEPLAQEPETAAENPAMASLENGVIGFITIEAETPQTYNIKVVFPGEYREFIDFSDFESESDPLV